MKKIHVTFLFVTIAFLANSQNSSFVWAKKMDGSSGISPRSLSTDPMGNVYTTGFFSGTIDFDPSDDVYNLTSSQDGTVEVYISKLDSIGNFAWAKSIGSISDEIAYSIASDSLGNVYVAGNFSLTVDFDPGIGINELTAEGIDAFILKLNTDGDFLWVKKLGGSSIDVPYYIALDRIGNIYTTGYFFGTADFDPGATVGSLTSTGDADVFVSKLDSDGNFVWAKNFGGAAGEAGYGLAVDSAGNVYTSGLFQSDADFDPSAFNYNLSSLGFSDIFIQKLDAMGNFLWAKQIGGNFIDYSFSLALDKQANVFTTGSFSDTVDFDPGIGTTFLTASQYGNSAFISKLDAAGNYVWAMKIGEVPTSNAEGYSIGIDASNNVYACGVFSSIADFDPSSNVYNLTSFGYNDAFVTRLTNSGDLIEALQFGGTLSDRSFGVKMDDTYNIYCTGDFGDTADFDPSNGVFNLISNGGAFVVKLGQSSTGLFENMRSEIVAYPNPTNGFFNFNIEMPIKNKVLEVYNNMGELIFNQKVTNQFIAIDLSTYSNGLYFLKVIQEGKQIESLKIVKQ